MNLGENIKALRTKMNVTQKEMSDKLGYSCQNISKWERGTSMPDIPTVAALAEYFNISVDELLGTRAVITEDGEILNAEALPKDEVLRLHTDINTQGPFTVWTDFEYNGTVAPDSVFFPGRHRTSEPRWSFPAYGAHIFIMAINKDGKIANAFYMMNAQRHELGFVLNYYYRENERYACIVPTREATMPDWIKQLKFEFLIPEGGYLLVASLNGLRAESLMKFIVPKSMHEYFPATASEKQRRRGTRYDDGCILRECFAPNSLDHINVRLENNAVIFTKPVDPNDKTGSEKPSSSAEGITDAILQAIEEKYGINIAELGGKLREIESRLDDLESRIDEAEECDIDDVMDEIEALGDRLGDLESRVDDLE